MKASGRDLQRKKNSSEYQHLKILDGLELLNAKSHTLDFPFHTHDTFNIALILDTTFTVKLTDKIIKAPQGSLSITNPDEVHATPCDQDLGNSFFTYYVSPEAITHFNNGHAVYFEDRTIYDPEIFDELYFLSSAYSKDLSAFEARLSEVLSALVRKHAVPKQEDFRTSRLFQCFINESNFDFFSLEKTASKFGINKYKFIRLFKQETGLTPNNFVLLKKVEKSKKMLKAGKPIFDVALDSGFYDSSHFYKNFKRFTGVNPLVFQNSIITK